MVVVINVDLLWNNAILKTHRSCCTYADEEMNMDNTRSAGNAHYTFYYTTFLYVSSLSLLFSPRSSKLWEKPFLRPIHLVPRVILLTPNAQQDGNWIIQSPLSAREAKSSFQLEQLTQSQQVKLFAGARNCFSSSMHSCNVIHHLLLLFHILKYSIYKSLEDEDQKILLPQ